MLKLINNIRKKLLKRTVLKMIRQEKIRPQTMKEVDNFVEKSMPITMDDIWMFIILQGLGWIMFLCVRIWAGL